MNRMLSIAFAALSLSLLPVASGATVVLTHSDPISSVQAELTISGDTLTVVLQNNSPIASEEASDLLTSFYFDISNGTNRPTLTYVSATGDVVTGDDEAADTLEEAAADLLGDQPREGTWQFRQSLTLANGDDTFAFGVGTVPNKRLKPNHFDKRIVNREEYGISSGDIESDDLDGALLVQNSATFTFSGLTGFTEDDISEVGMFGFGIKPSHVHLTKGHKNGAPVPEPANALLLGTGLLGLALAGRSRRPA